MKFLQTFLIGLLLLIADNSSGQSANELIGIWLTTDGKSKIQIVKDQGETSFSGRIIWLKTPLVDGNPRKDENGNFVMGLAILNDFRFDSDEWEGGTIYDPESGSTYYCTMTLQSKNKLKVRGSVDPMGWIGRTETWHRVVNK